MTQWEHEITRVNGQELKAVFRICRVDTNPQIGMGFYYPRIPINENVYATRGEATDAMKVYVADMPKEERNLHCVTAGWVPLHELERYTFVTPNWCTLPNPDHPAMATTTAPAKFVKDEIYKARFMGDADLVNFWEVQSTTSKRVTVLCLETNEVKTVGIHTDRDGNEFCYPYGKYSMALQIRAVNVSF